jgi:hypothetical protein
MARRLVPARLITRPGIRTARNSYQRSAASVCTAVHHGIVALGLSRVPMQLALKHTYDYHVFEVDPHAITYRIATAVPWPSGRRGVPAMVAHGRRRLAEGGSWKSVQRQPTRSLYGRFVLGGDWDERKEPFEALPSLVGMFCHGVPYEETDEYRLLRRQVLQGDFRYTKGCTTVGELDSYFKALHRLYADIRSNGYKTQRELGGGHADEIRVCVDRDGQLGIIGGGTHRLSIAKILDVTAVPVIVKRVHALWVDDCRRRYGGNTRTAIATGLQALFDDRV